MKNRIPNSGYLYSKVEGILDIDSYKTQDYDISIPDEDLYTPYIRIKTEGLTVPSRLDTSEVQLREIVFSFDDLYPTIVYKGLLPSKIKGYKTVVKSLFNGRDWETQLRICKNDPKAYMKNELYRMGVKLFTRDIRSMSRGCFAVYRRDDTGYIKKIDCDEIEKIGLIDDKMFIRRHFHTGVLYIDYTVGSFRLYKKADIFNKFQDKLSAVIGSEWLCRLADIITKDTDRLNNLKYGIIKKNVLKVEYNIVGFDKSNFSLSGGSINIYSDDILVKSFEIRGIYKDDYAGCWVGKMSPRNACMESIGSDNAYFYQTTFLLNGSSDYEYYKILSLMYFSVYNEIEDGTRYVYAMGEGNYQSGKITPSILTVPMLYYYTFKPLGYDWYKSVNGILSKEILNNKVIKPKYECGLSNGIGGLEYLSAALEKYAENHKNDDTSNTDKELLDYREESGKFYRRCGGFEKTSKTSVRYVGRNKFLKDLLGDALIRYNKFYLSKDGESLFLMKSIDTFTVLSVDNISNTVNEEVGYTYRLRNYHRGTLDTKKLESLQGRVFAISDDKEYLKDALKSYYRELNPNKNWVGKICDSLKYNRYGGFNAIFDNPVEIILFFNGFVVLYNKYTGKSKIVSGKDNVDMSQLSRTLSIPVVKKLRVFHNLDCDVYAVDNIYGKIENGDFVKHCSKLSDVIEISIANKNHVFYATAKNPQTGEKLCQMGIRNGSLDVLDHGTVGTKQWNVI